jgi:GT2 family glycosyltransferase
VENGTDTYNLPPGYRSIGLNNIELSVIIVNYKSWNVLQQCLDSFQQFPPRLNYEIIVIDNDSQDGEFDVFAINNPQIKLIKNSGNNGFSNGCNLGAENTTGEYLLFLNPDVILTSSSTIDGMVGFAKKNTDVGIVSCRTINPKGKPEREIAFENPWLIIGWIRAIYKLLNKKQIALKYGENEDNWYPDWVAGSVILIKSALFNKINKWDQDNYWMYYEDVDLCRKVVSLGKKIALLRNFELRHAHGGSSRRNPATTAITKSEVVTSNHMFVQIYTQGINRVALHSLMVVNTLISWSLRTLLTLPVFWKDSFQSNLLTLVAIIQYYVRVPTRGTWKSKRLNNNGT